MRSSAELGWTGDLPHPMAYQYPGSSDIELLRHQAKQVGIVHNCVQDMSCCMLRFAAFSRFCTL
jgi:hypothetical protein